jgi:hypothetical protein
VADDALDAVLRLVAEGRLTAEEAGPIIDALEAGSRPRPTSEGLRPTGAAATSPGGGPGRAIRVEVTEGGLKVVNLRVPLSLGRAALSRIPGLSESMADRIREAIDAGVSGPVLVVNDGPEDTVRIVVE